MKRVEDILPCGHPRSEYRLISYRCAGAIVARDIGVPGCKNIHVTGRCQICFDAGSKPDDFGEEIKRKKA